MTTVKTVNLSELAEEITDLPFVQLEILRQAAIQGIIRSIPDLVERSPVDTGRYAASWDMSVSETEIVLGNFAPHAGIIELGARPFKPPIGPLLQWAKRVLQDGSQPPNYSNAVWGLAKYTQAKIEKFGIEPRHVLEKSLPFIIENIRSEFEGL